MPVKQQTHHSMYSIKTITCYTQDNNEEMMMIDDDDGDNEDIDGNQVLCHQADQYKSQGSNIYMRNSTQYFNCRQRQLTNNLFQINMCMGS